MQILADLLTLLEVEAQREGGPVPRLSALAGKKVAWVGDSNNILNDMLVAYPRLGIDLSVAAPSGDAYAPDPLVWTAMEDGVSALPQGAPRGHVTWTNDPAAAVRDADYIVTDTWYVDLVTLGCRWAMRRKRTNVSRTLPASRSPRSSPARAPRSPIGSSCTACPGKPRKFLTRCASMLTSGVLWPALACVPGGRKPQVDGDGLLRVRSAH